MPKVIKPSNPFTNVCWVSVLTFSRRHKFWLHRQFSSAQFQKRRNDGYALCGYCCQFVLNSKRLLSTSCNKQDKGAVRHFFHGVIPDAFWSSRIVCVEKIKQTSTMSWNFILLIFINVCQVWWIVIVFGLTMSTALTGNFSAGVSGNN